MHLTGAIRFGVFLMAALLSGKYPSYFKLQMRWLRSFIPVMV